jgi:hypothetical protein
MTFPFPITEITESAPACFGFDCQGHAQCERYHLIETAAEGTPRIGTCGEGHDKPLFIPIAVDRSPA